MFSQACVILSASRRGEWYREGCVVWMEMWHRGECLPGGVSAGRGDVHPPHEMKIDKIPNFNVILIVNWKSVYSPCCF